MLAVNYKPLFRHGEWEGKQQDASQETCLSKQLSSSREKERRNYDYKTIFYFLLICDVSDYFGAKRFYYQS